MPSYRVNRKSVAWSVGFPEALVSAAVAAIIFLVANALNGTL